jgi:hypothetical protein
MLSWRLSFDFRRGLGDPSSPSSLEIDVRDALLLRVVSSADALRGDDTFSIVDVAISGCTSTWAGNV